MSPNTKASPKIELYLIRHAESVMNTTAHLIGGRSNETPLSKLGIKQAQDLGRQLKITGILPDKVYASPAVRTIQTASYCLQAMHLDTQPIIHDALQELAQGDWEGKPRAEVYTEERLKDITRLGKDFRLVGGESMNDVAERMHNWATETISSLKPANQPQRFFVFTHGGAIKNFASHILDWDHPTTYTTPIDNATISLFTHQNNTWQVVYLNRHAKDL